VWQGGRVAGWQGARRLASVALSAFCRQRAQSSLLRGQRAKPKAPRLRGQNAKCLQWIPVPADWPFHLPVRIESWKEAQRTRRPSREPSGDRPVGVGVVAGCNRNTTPDKRKAKSEPGEVPSLAQFCVRFNREGCVIRKTVNTLQRSP